LLGLSGYFWQNSKKEQVKTQSMLYDNIVQQGVIYRDYLKNILASKLNFAKSISESITIEQEEKSKIYLNSLKVNSIKLVNIFENSDSMLETILSQDENLTSWARLKEEEFLNGVLNRNETKFLAWNENNILELWESNGTKPLQIFEHNNSILGARFSKMKKKYFLGCWVESFNYGISIVLRC